MQVIGLLFYLFGAIDFLLWLLLDMNLTHTSWSPLAAGLLGRACIAFGAVTTAPARVPKATHEVVASGAPQQTHAPSKLTVVHAIVSLV